MQVYVMLCLNQAQQILHHQIRSTNSPVGIAMWRNMAEALGWPARPVTFKQLAALALNRTSGWGSVDPQYASWGRFRMGHGHPATSNSGVWVLIGSAFCDASLVRTNSQSQVLYTVCRPPLCRIIGVCLREHYDIKRRPCLCFDFKCCKLFCCNGWCV